MRNNNRGPDILSTGDYLGLKFSDEGWWFTHILETETVELKPWILRNEDGDRGEIAPKTAGAEGDSILDTVGRNFIVPGDDEKNLIYQILVGVSPSRMRIYPIFGRDRTPNLKGTAEPGEPQVAYDGFDSPYNNPTRQSEMFTVNNMSQPSLQAYNPMDEPVEARLSFVVNKMKYATIEDVKTMNAMLQGQMPYREHPMGLGAQARDQVRAPGWLVDAFGSNLHTTEEILNAGDTETGLPSTGSLGSNMGGR